MQAAGLLGVESLYFPDRTDREDWVSRVHDGLYAA